MKKKKLQRNNNVRLERTVNEKTGTAMWSFTLHALFLLSAILMGLRVFTLEGITLSPVLMAVILLFLLAFIFELLLPFVTRRLWKPFRIAIPWLAAGGVVYLSGKLFYAYYLENQLDIEDGLLQLADEYMDIYNSYYQKHIVLPPGNARYVALAFVFCLLIAIIVQYLLVHLTGVKAFMLLLPCTMLAAELWIGLTPDAISLFVFSASCILLAVGQGSSWKVKGVSVLLWTLLFGLSVLAFRGTAENMILKAPEYKAYQKRFEAQLKNISISNIWGGRETVTNKKPKFSDKEILSITSDKRTNGNLYLKTFVGTRYENGSWLEDNRSYADACKAQKIDENQMNELLWNTIVDAQKESSFYIHSNILNYTIRYKRNLQSKALLPYFADLADKNNISCQGDQTLKITRGTKEITVSGFGANDSEHVTLPMLSNYDIDGLSDKKWDWYGKFVLENYMDTNEQVKSALTLAKSMTNHISGQKSGKNTNLMRLYIAEEVAAFLSENYTYSWNLDEITDGTDPTEYFLASGKKGYCMHFATAGTLILREMGIPARYAAGYVVKSGAFEKNGDGTFTAPVLDRNAHAWTEIYLDYIGWVPIEMTAGFSQPGAVLPTDKEVAKEREEREQNSQTKEQETETTEETESEAETEPETQTEPETEPENGSEEETESEAETEENTASETQFQTESKEETNGQPGNGGGLQGQQGTAENSEGQTLPWWKTKAAGIVGKIMLLLIATAAACGCVITLVRKHIRKYHELLDRDIRRKRYRRAVRRMNRRIYKKLRRTAKLRRAHMKDREYEQHLADTFGEISATTWAEYMVIVKKAAFSGEELTQKEAMFCYEIYRTILLEHSVCQP